MIFAELPWPVDYAAENRGKLGKLVYLDEHQEIWAAVYNHYKPRERDAEQWAAACIRWIEDWVVTYDPRRKGVKKVPFKLFKKQKEFVYFIVRCLLDKEAGLVEKSRDIGASWLCTAIATWLWIYVKGASIGFGSMLQTKVDRVGDMDSLFEKIRFIIRNLPALFVPVGYKERQHATFMKIRNPENGAIIKGEGGDNIGRGGRSMLYFKDEAAHYQRPELIEAALGDNTDVQIDISSVNGTANVFYRRRMSGELWAPDRPSTKGKTRVFVFDWRHHPGKTQEWYDARRQKAEDEGMLHVFAQEVDRDYAGSIDRIIIPAPWLRACVDAHIKLAHLGDWSAGGDYAGQDLADEGNDKNALAGRKGRVLRYADHWGGDPGEAAHKAIPACIELGIYELFYDCIGVGAGFKVETNSMKKLPSWPAKMRVYPWNASHSGDNLYKPEGRIIPNDKESPQNKDFYKNLKAQAWFMLRTAVWKTYQAVTQGKVFPVSEMVSFSSEIPLIEQVLMELAQAVHAYASDGKTMVDKKPDGAHSPNMADSVVMCYLPIRPAKGFFDIK